MPTYFKNRMEANVNLFGCCFAGGQSSAAIRQTQTTERTEGRALAQVSFNVIVRLKISDE